MLNLKRKRKQLLSWSICLRKQLPSWILRLRRSTVLALCAFVLVLHFATITRNTERKILTLFGAYYSPPQTQRLLRQFEILPETTKEKFAAAKLFVSTVSSLDEIHKAHGSVQSTHFDIERQRAPIFDRIVNGAQKDGRCHLMRVRTADIQPYLTLNGSVSKAAPKNESRGVMQKLTVVVNTWRREDCLLSVIRHWQQCAEVVDAIVVVSADPTSEERWATNASLRNALSSGWPVPVRIHSKCFGSDRLTDRFLFDGSVMKTEALFSVDDDIVYSCSLLRDSFALWLALGKQTAVGFEPRNVRFDYVDTAANSHSANSPENIRTELLSKSDSVYGIDNSDSTFGHCRYNAVLLTLGGIMHRRYYEEYFGDSMRFVRRIVDGNVTAEDMAMSFMYSRMNARKPPLAVLYTDKDVSRQKCEQKLSVEMHRNKELKRINLAIDSLVHLGFGTRDSGLRHSPVFVSLV